MPGMARAATTADVFNAVAEPRRREILDLLAGGERPVNDLVARLHIAQPHVSKHLRVLRGGGAVDGRAGGGAGGGRGGGGQPLSGLKGGALKPIHDWVSRHERLWSERFEALDDV